MMKRILWWLIAGTKGGTNRARIILLLHDRPYNANQIAEELSMDYKTARHHIKTLVDNDMIVSSGKGKKGYGNVYFLSPLLEANFDTFNEIWEQIGNKDKKGKKPVKNTKEE